MYILFPQKQKQKACFLSYFRKGAKKDRFLDNGKTINKKAALQSCLNAADRVKPNHSIL
jgi:hypothetical protein